MISTRVGYSGGDIPNATYRNHGDHAEAVEIVFDPDVISFRELLEFFFQIHDPSTKNRQGNDLARATARRSSTRARSRSGSALDTIADVDASGLWPGKVVTEVTAAGPFWEAEPEHQDYLSDPERLHLPLRAAGLGAAAPRGAGRSVAERLTAGEREGRTTRWSSALALYRKVPEPR